MKKPPSGGFLIFDLSSFTYDYSVLLIFTKFVIVLPEQTDKLGVDKQFFSTNFDFFQYSNFSQLLADNVATEISAFYAFAENRFHITLGFAENKPDNLCINCGD